MTAWPHQTKLIADILDAIAKGYKRILATSPTGGGKSFVMQELARHYLEQHRKVALYANRKMLIDQISDGLMQAGLYHGIRAADYADERDHYFQVSSIQTEGARTLKSGKWQLHDAELALIDEAHLNKAKTMKRIMDAHNQEGAVYVGLTATPLDLADLYDVLIIGGTNSELRDCGALVSCDHYGPTEPDLKHVGKVPLGQDLTEKQNVKAIMVPGIFARVLEWYDKLNPNRKPSILFAPGVAESIWFAEQFRTAGVSAAHIDGDEVWLNGETYKSSREARQEVLTRSKSGDIKIICNRFVLREGIDAPWLEHGIFATVFGSLQSYIQSGGRLLRASPGKTHAVIQDHGGAWWRHGSLNSDREWRLEYTATLVSGLREERMRHKTEREPVRCPQCSLILVCGKCKCGFKIDLTKKSRPVIQASGELRQMGGDIFRPRRISKAPDGPKIWERMYHRSRTGKGERTFRAAAALFAAENNWGWPDQSWPFMPKSDEDWFRLVKDVPRERLT